MSGMVTNRKLKADLLERLGVTKQRLSQRVRKLKDQVPMTTPEATYVIAHREGLDLTKYLDDDVVDTVRALVQGTSGAEPQRAAKSNAKRRKEVVIRIAPSLDRIPAYLPQSIARDAKRMAEIYPTYYVLENTLRVVIMRVLEGQRGRRWWDELVSNRVRRNVADRKAKEKECPWHGKRGKHEIFYSDFGDLLNIIRANWQHFSELFPRQSWITEKLEQLEHPRNVLAHHNAVSETDADRIELNFKDIMRQLDSRRDALP